MSEEIEGAGEQPEKTRGRATVVIALTIGLIAGTGAGSFVVGPLVADAPEPEASPVECVNVDGHGAPAAPGSVHLIENIVLNPAESGGTRFLMASVGFGLTDAHGAEQMAARDPELRDMVVRVLGSKTVAQLSDLPTREAIKQEMREETAKLVGNHGLVDVYFPQFVIQ